MHSLACPQGFETESMLLVCVFVCRWLPCVTCNKRLRCLCVIFLYHYML